MTSPHIPPLRLLGSFALWIEGHEVIGLPRKARALLAFLAMQPDRRISREVVADLLWTNSGPEQARHSLRQLLVVVRRTPARDIVRNDSDTLWIETGAVAVDALLLTATPADSQTALAEAALLCRGALLQDLPPVSPGFEEWLQPLRARLAQVTAQTLHRYASARLADGAFDAATEIAARLVRLDALDEAAHRLLMNCLARSGQRTKALRQFESCVRTLRDELNVSPQVETIALAEEIRAGIDLPDIADVVPRADRLPAPCPGEAEQPDAEQPLTPTRVAIDGPAEPTVAATEPAPGWHRPRSGVAWIAMAVALAVIAVVTFAFWPSPKQPPGIAVAGFHNVSGIPAQDLVAAGLNDLVIIRLATQHHLRLTDAPRTGMEVGPNIAGSIEQSEDKRYRLEGSAAVDTNAMHVAARLTDARVGTELWSAQYDRSINQAPRIADDIATHVARAVSQDHDIVAVSPQRLFVDQRRVARELVNLGHQMDYFRSTANPGAKDVYQLALDFDKNNVDALAHLSTVYIRSALDGSPASTAALTEADAYLRQAMQLDPTNTFVLFNGCLMRRLQGRITDAIVLCERALDIDPRNPGALRELGHNLLEAGEADEAIVSYRAAIDAGPYMPFLYNAFKGLGVASLALGRRADAIVDFEKSAELDIAKEDDEQLWLAAVLEMDGRQAEAASTLKAFLVRHPGLRVGDNYLRLLSAPAYAGRREEVLAALASAGDGQ